jgi:hypothetical protein
MRRVGDVFSWNRPDSLGAALAAASIACLVWHRQNPATKSGFSWRLVLSAICAVGAVYTKQLAGCVVLAAVLHFALEKSWKELAVYTGTGIALGLPVFFAAQWATGGGYLYNIWTLTSGMTLFSGFHWFRNVALYFLGNSVAVCVLLGTFAWVVQRGWPSSSELRLLLVYAPLALAAGTVTCWHVGGSLQYYAWGTIGLAMLGGSALGEIAGKGSTTGLIAALLALVCATGGQRAMAHLLPWQTLREQWPAPWTVRVPDLSQAERVFRETGVLDGEVLFDRMPGLAVLQGRRVDVEPSALAVLKSKGLWQGKVLSNDLKKCRWRYVVGLNLDPDQPYVFFGDSELNTVFHHHYGLVRSLPLDGAAHQRVPLAQIYEARPLGTGTSWLR